ANQTAAALSRRAGTATFFFFFQPGTTVRVRRFSRSPNPNPTRRANLHHTTRQADPSCLPSTCLPSSVCTSRLATQFNQAEIRPATAECRFDLGGAASVSAFNRQQVESSSKQTKRSMHPPTQLPTGVPSQPSDKQWQQQQQK
ncbi:unnamed protein product, partial [Ectocarpus sp. 12 AP-2014]